MFGIRDHKICDCYENALTLSRADEICRAAKSTVTQLKLMDDTAAENVGAVNISATLYPNARTVTCRKKTGAQHLEGPAASAKKKPLCCQVSEHEEQYCR